LGAVTRFPDGAGRVFAVGDSHVVKLVSAPSRDSFVNERELLTKLEHRLEVETPRLYATGELDGWSYLVMEQLPGRTLRTAWGEISPVARLKLGDRIGGLIAELHSVPLGGLMPVDWHAFLNEQVRTCVARHEAEGVAEHWLAQIPAYLASVSLPIERSVLLHTEIMREHLLVVPTDDGVRLVGLVDFERAMPGAPEYEFAAVGLFLAEGDHLFLRAVLCAYGVATGEQTAALRRQFLAYSLLHRHGNLRWFLERLPVPSASTLEELADIWWRT
jgi:hygromycin-B 7''-O-kinase